MEYPQPSSNGEVTNTDSRFSNMLKSLTAAQSYMPTQINPSDYDVGKLASVVSDAAAAAAAGSSSMQDQAKSAQQRAEENTKNKEGEAAEDEEDVDASDESDDNILKMIKKIVKTGINIAKKGKTIAAGLKEVPTGIGELIANIAIMAMIVGIDTGVFIVQLCVYLFKLLICTVQKLLDIPKCVVFYLIDIAVFIVIAVIVSFLFIIDMVFLVKTWTGIGCVETFFATLKLVKVIDDMIYDNTTIHIFKYPEPLLKLCYSCSSMGDTSGFWKAAGSLFDDIFVMLPTNIGGPISEIIKGFGHIFSFFDL